jgi:hypothetical protein
MSNVSCQTAIALKNAGLPQPTPEPGMMWYLPKLGSFPGGEYPPYIINYVLGEKVFFSSIGGMVDEKKHVGHMLPAQTFLANAFFTPALEYIVSLLPIPELFHFEIWNNTPYCRFRYDENPRRTFGETFAEAAAKMYLELKQNAPGPDISEPGDVAQE